MSLSDVSDLTDISSSDVDGSVPLSKRTTKAKKEPKEYKITRVLRAPRTAQYTAKSLYDQIIDNTVDLDPEYQRDVVWQEEKQSGLIDSILRNYYIPPIIFAVMVQDDGSELRTCIDGKQRLTSIQRFIDGQIPRQCYVHNVEFRTLLTFPTWTPDKDSFTNEKLWFKTTATATKRKLLPQHLRTLFVNKQIVCVEYTELDVDQEREIFQRVQLGVALTPAERLQALVGPWSTVIREIQNQVLGEEGFDGYLDWGHARGRDFQCLATIGYLIENHPKTVIPGTKTLEKWLQKTQPVSTQLHIDLHDTFRIFVTLARDKKYSGSLNRPTRVSPIEFVMIGVLIYLKRQTLSLTQISSAIEKMRKDVRASHQDIRSNTRVTKHLVEFMETKIRISDLRSDGEGDTPAALAVGKTAKPSKPAKRKRPADSDESDIEPTPRVKPTKPSTNSVPAQVPQSSKQISRPSDQKTNVTKKASATPNTQTSLALKPSQTTTSSRKTNNSLSNIFTPSAPKSSLPASATQPSSSQAPQPPRSISNSNGVHTKLTTPDSVRPPPLTIQTGPTVKVESPQMSSPAVMSAVDRLAPIRAAKATLGSSSCVQAAMSKDIETSDGLKHGVNISQTLVDPRQNPPITRPVMEQPAVVSSKQPLPHFTRNSGQGRPNPPQLEGVLQNLRLQFPQLGGPLQSKSNDAVNPATLRQNAQANGNANHPVTPASIPGPMNTGAPNNMGHVSRRDSTTQRAYNDNMSRSLEHVDESDRPNTLRPFWGSSHPPPPNYSTANSVGMHTLPQRPTIVPTAPRNSMRAEPLGPHGSASSESTNQDGRRGSYSKDRHRPPDNRRPYRNDRNYDYDRDWRNRS